MLEEKINTELEEPDDFSSLNIYNQWIKHTNEY